jgi:endoglucanase
VKKIWCGCILSLVVGLAASRGFADDKSTLTFLHTHGNDIVNEAGQPVLLRGVGLGNWMLPEGYMWHFGEFGDRPRHIEKIVSDLIGDEDAKKFWHEYRSNYISEKDIDRIADLGFNSVRPVLDARLFLSEGDNPQFLDEGFALLDNVIQWSKARNLYVIIDMHAAPGGQTGLNIDDSATNEPLLFMDKKYEPRLTALWVKIAQRYKDEPAVAMYDLLNEPLPKRTGADAKYGMLLEPLYKRVTAAIREVDKKHAITIEGSNFAGDWTVFSKPFDDNLVYQFHYYCRATPTELKSMQDWLDQQKRLGMPPVWVGECGERDATIYWGTTDLLESHNMGWSFWPWKKMDTSNTPYSIDMPKGWEMVRKYSETGSGEKPDSATAHAIFDEYLRNIRLENCVYYPAVVDALLRRVPGRVQAEDYGHEGAEKSYHVLDLKKLSADYRKSEPVQIEPLGWRAQEGQAVVLAPGEWTAYGVNSREEKAYTLTARFRGGSVLGKLRITVGDQTVEAIASGPTWTEIKLGDVSLKKGENRVQIEAEQGTVAIDWLDFE